MNKITKLLVALALLITQSKARTFRGADVPAEKLTHPLLRDEFEPSLNIFYGDDAAKGQFPFMVRLSTILKYATDGYGSTWGGRCGGSIISERHILTAAHCVAETVETPNGDEWLHPFQPRNIYVWVGDHSSYSTDSGESIHRVEAVLIHKDYVDWDVLNDIAVLVLAEEIDFSKSTGLAEAINLPVTSDAYLRDEGSAVTVAGWGMDETGGLADTLQYLEYQFASTSDCDAYYYGWVEDGMICSADLPLPSEKRTWGGDSGGPLFVKRDNGNTTVLGLVSWGTSDPTEKDSYDVNTDVWYYRDWVSAMMGNNDRIRSERVDSDGSVITGEVDVVRYMNTWHYFYTDELKYVKAVISLENFAANDIVLVYEAPSGSLYDGGSLIAGLTGGDEGTFYSTLSSGLIIMVSSDNGASHGSFSYEISAVDASPGNSPTACGEGFWACEDQTYCIYDHLKCDMDPEWAQCYDLSDEQSSTCEAAPSSYYLMNPYSVDGEDVSEGIVVKKTENGSYYGCDDNMGGNVAQTACRHFGYTTGDLISPLDFLSSTEADDLTFGATALSCPADASNLDDCEMDFYDEESSVPCFEGEQIAVRCVYTPWVFEISDFSTYTMSRNGGTSIRGRAWCSVTAKKYDEDVDQKQDLQAMLYNYKQDGSMELINDEGKYKKSKGMFKLKIRKDLESGESMGDQCFVCVVYAGSSSKYTYAVDKDCAVSGIDESSHEMISRLIEEAYTDTK